MNRRQSGQIVVEYTLLLVVAIAIVTILVGLLVSRGESRGYLIQAWSGIIFVIGDDLADDLNN